MIITYLFVALTVINYVLPQNIVKLIAFTENENNILLLL